MKSTLGGALAAFGTFLFGVPYMLNTMSPDFPKPLSVWCMGIGILLNGLGIFFGTLFSADSKEVKQLCEKVEANQTQIESNRSQIAVTKDAVISGDTETLKATPAPVHNPS